MSDYTPTTERVRYYFAANGTSEVLAEDFDRWFASELAKERQRGREDAAKAVHEIHLTGPDGMLGWIETCRIDHAVAAARGESQ